jgi:signal transduction histidine kinase
MTFPPALLAVLSLATLVAFGAICAAAGALWMKTRAAAALREATQDRLRLLALADHWVWETDVAHRLTAWRAPSQRPEGWRSAPALGTPLTELARPMASSVPASGAGSPSASAALAGSPRATPLSRQMDAHAPIPSQRVMLRLGDAAQTWSLRGEPRHDGAGGFLGYVGSALPVGEAEAAEFGRAAFAQLLPQLDAAVLLFRRANETAPWRLAASGSGQPELKALKTLMAAQGGGAASAATDGIDCDELGTDAPDWQAACGRLPADVAHALEQMQAGETRTVGEWRVSWSAVVDGHDPQGGRLVVLRKTTEGQALVAAAPAVALVDPTAPTVDVADHESFIYSVSHDLRAPIRVVEGFARILKEDYGRFLDRIGNDHTDRILAAAARMNSMIDALLALSRLQSQPIKRQPVDLSQLTRYTLEDLRSGEPEREAEIVIEPGLVVQGDPTLMRIAIENLIGNAWKYSGQSPKTRIELRRETLAGQVTYVVEDAGAGFDMRFADRLFGVFQRLHSAKDFQGTGVGLASVRRIIRRHGGDIWAESEVGKGARFYFTLP